MRWIIFVLNLYGCLQWISGQFVNLGCPAGWQMHDTKCYRFGETLMVFEEADAYCWNYGAKLVSVSTYTEHKFINDWLMGNEYDRVSYWYTSGQWYQGILYWQGDQKIQDPTTATYWLSPPKYTTSSLGAIQYRIVYAFGGNMNAVYGWANVTSSRQGYPICEIPKDEIADLYILERDFDYGLGTSEPKTIQTGPVIEIEPKNMVMLEGATSLEFFCFASGNPFPKYRWFYGDNFTTSVELQSSARRTLSGNSLMISQPTEQDVGSYHCQAENDVGVVRSNRGKMIMGNLGYFSNIDPQPVLGSAFRGAKMDCDTPAFTPGVSYEWFKNYATYVFIWPENVNFFNSHSGSLYISEVQPTDADKRYFCVVSLIATEGFEMAKANTISRTNRGFLLLLSSDSTSGNDYGPIINTHAFPSPALKGRTTRLECVAYGTHPLTYSWAREDGRDFVEGTEITHLGRVLTIKNTPISAEGNYICTCVRGSGARATKTISVYIEAIPYFPYAIKNMLVDPGMDIKWNCKAVSRPAATYTWYKNGKMLQTLPGKIVIRKNVLQIFNVDKDADEGMYQCAATNQHGTNFSTGQLKVLSFPPNFKRFPLPDVTLTANGANLTIPCRVEAAPKPDVAWLKNGGNLNLFPGELNGKLGMTAQYGLIISPVAFSDQGIYTCSVSNILGEAADTTQVIVTEGARLIQPPTDQTVQVNRTAFFYCQASYNNQYDLAYIWKFNGYVIDFRSNPDYVSGRRQGVDGLYVTNAQYKHEGVYECEAKTTMNSAIADAHLEVVGPPGPPAGLYADDETVTARSVRLVWTVSQFIHHGGPITAYDFEAESNYKPGIWTTVMSDVPEYYAATEAINSGKRTDQRAFTVDNLIPNTSYRFRVRAVNMYGRGQEPSTPTKTVKIGATEPVLAPKNVTGGGGSEGTLTMTWNPLDISEQCGPGIGYWVYWKKKGEERDWKKDKAQDQKALEQGIFVAEVGMNNYYLEYQFMVAAFNDMGHGPNTSVTFIYSAMGMPAAVPITYQVDSVNCTAIEVFWEPVKDDRENMKGRVAGYRIMYYENLGPEDINAVMMDGEPDPTKVGMKERNVYGQQNSALIIGLTPNNEQFVRVQVFNTAGYGPKGEWRRAETMNNPLSNYPTFVEVDPLDEHSVNVRWRGVSIKPLEESLQGYILRVWKIQEDVRSATDTRTGKENHGTVTGLQKNTVYVIRVLGYSRAGDGAISSAVYFSVLGGRIPFDPTTTDICYAFDDETRTCGSEQFYSSGIVLVIALLVSYIMWK